MNYAALFAPMYRLRGVAVTLTPDGSAGSFELTAIDKSSGVDLDGQAQTSRRNAVQVATMVPVAQVRASELEDNGLTRDDLRKATLAMNGKTYRVERSVPKPTLAGEAEGQVWLVLSEINASA